MKKKTPSRRRVARSRRVVKRKVKKYLFTQTLTIRPKVRKMKSAGSTAGGTFGKIVVGSKPKWTLKTKGVKVVKGPGGSITITGYQPLGIKRKR